jgi:hypothetical protein
VLEKPAVDVAGHADISDSGFAGKDIDPILPHAAVWLNCLGFWDLFNSGSIRKAKADPCFFFAFPETQLVSHTH